jgi:hypothetical protein
VYVDPGVDCDVKCDEVSCKEVEQLEGGVCWKSGNQEAEDGGDDGDVDARIGSTWGNWNGTISLNGVNFTVSS